MIKIFGALFIILATTWGGFEISRHLSERPKQLRWFKSALQSLEAEIMYGHTPLHEAARKLSPQFPKPLSIFFSSFAEKLLNNLTTVKNAWESSLQEIWKMTSLKQNEYEILKQFGENLGKHDRLTEQKNIHLTITHLEREEKDAYDRQKRYEKMVKSMGFLTGLLIVILLM
ncbi:stage III sporulation protein SpoIIIAB [Bacillus sp. FJAT-49736]|uniref:stage III sporulation protein SpoIIIAB n=1 Tax=Bacillus sp. FJAT-49736 TaxID=2833582 RepID=UPI001BC98A62|nr:stage III sporulation protein SpoIIIAB [Bacillus sp. FJAT-49736]MBS4173429.1 stage III sporulation protein SpoAB [Bacillus sp. FJAT-49736]